MAKQPDTKTKAAKAETPAPKGEANGRSDSDGSKKPPAPGRPASFFSCVANDDYRSGWDNIFSSKAKKSTRKPGKSGKSAVAKRKNKLPASITLGADDLDAATREQLEAVFRRHAKKKRLNYDKLSANGQVSWQISCRISST